MVQRRLLTADFVNRVQPPEKGEAWIADTRLKGFGLRLFASAKLGKSFAIRVTDETGFVTRRSFDIYRSWTYRSRLRDSRFEFEPGEFLDDARLWARWEIEKLKHLNLADGLDRRDRDEVAQLVRNMTLVRAAESPN